MPLFGGAGISLSTRAFYYVISFQNRDITGLLRNSLLMNLGSKQSSHLHLLVYLLQMLAIAVLYARTWLLGNGITHYAIIVTRPYYPRVRPKLWFARSLLRSVFETANYLIQVQRFYGHSVQAQCMKLHLFRSYKPTGYSSIMCFHHARQHRFSATSAYMFR